MKAVAIASESGSVRPATPTLTEPHPESDDQLAFFRALPLALGLSALCWIVLAALGFGIYTLVNLR